MSDRRWPSMAEIPTMSAEEAYDLYWHLPGTADPAQRAIITALGDHAWAMRQAEDAGKPKPQWLPMPEAPVAAPVTQAPKKPKFSAQKPAREEPVGGSQFFLAGLKP